MPPTVRPGPNGVSFSFALFSDVLVHKLHSHASVRCEGAPRAVGGTVREQAERCRAVRISRSGDATETSDVDVIVVLDGEVDPRTELQRKSEPVYDLELETEEMITLYPISQTEFEDREHPFLTNVRREGIMV